MTISHTPKTVSLSSGFVGFITQDDHYIARSFNAKPRTEKSILDFIISLSAEEEQVAELFSALVSFPRWVTFTSHPEEEYQSLFTAAEVVNESSAYKIVPDLGIALSPKFFKENDNNLWIAGRLNNFFKEEKTRVTHGEQGYLITEDLSKIIVVVTELSTTGHVTNIISEHSIVKKITEQERLRLQKEEYRAKLFADEQTAWEMEQRERLMNGKDSYHDKYSPTDSLHYYGMMYRH